MNQRIRNLAAGFVVSLLVVGSGALEDWFEKSEYSSDAISYLDISKAVSRGDWTLALTPYWSIGYPMILAATRWMFPPGPQGEWTAIHAVNLAIFVATYLSFLYLLKVAVTYTAMANGAEQAESGNGLVFAIGTSIFLLWQLQTGNVSRVSPDLAVNCIFFLLMAASLRFCLRPSVTTASLMGFLMGIGYVIKAILLPLSSVVVLVVVLHSFCRLRTDRRSTIAKLTAALPAMAIPALPYVAALSTVAGHFTLGDSGSLNYAWEVNGLTHWHWQGGPAPFGMPIHPLQLVLKNPPVFQFAEPFPVTYPPWFNPSYWYEGYRHFFNPANQIYFFKVNLLRFGEIFFNTPHAPVKAVVSVSLLLASTFLLKDRQIFWGRLIALWPLYLPSTAAVGIYLLVFTEPRYLVGFLIILLTTIFLPLFVPTQLLARKNGYALVIVLAAVSAAVLLKSQAEVLRAAWQGKSYTSNEQWRIALYLAQSGVRPGEKVAFVRVERGTQSTWAYLDGLHIVAEIGNQGFSLENQEKDFELFTGSPEVQQTVFNLFRKAGAVLVVALDVNGAPQGSGWERVPETQSWVHRLDGSP